MGIGLLIAFALALGLSAALGALIRPLARRLGFLDRPDLERKEGRFAIPYGGGLAMVGALTVGIGLLFWLCAAKRVAAPEWLEIAFPDLVLPERAALIRMAYIAGGGLLVFLVGMVDDARGLRPAIKLCFQVVAALLLVAGGVRVTAFIDNTAASAVLTVLWIVGITNSFNLLDNMDGLTAGIAGIAAFIFAMVQVWVGEPFLAVTLALLAGVAAGFLVHNFHPARLYMGDAGSYFLGFLLSALSVEATFYRYSESQSCLAPPAMLAVGVPLLILAVPMFDTASVLWIRLREGRPLWVGDRSHLSHRLVGIGLSVRQAVLTIYLLTAACGIGALLLKNLSAVGGALVLAQAATILAVVAILEGLGRRGGNGST
jgi:UDP-GlcNAc:undecaprenyl-phosphate/decaprenyl-phosphate GlcNAc-1-phosphate transferase